ncbi:Glycosyl Hydrolase Family 88 [Olivibacter domesticus]|uniref:Glycosyl Hydrolase Family 88 n=2 Tax=Olivibacter domesticus TaxID=407022 RepID=A0A1H7QFI4_OLID1|nr:Glycosyl Hydrolase Family 88 [Olivibacter domesticus]
MNPAFINKSDSCRNGKDKKIHFHKKIFSIICIILFTCIQMSAAQSTFQEDNVWELAATQSKLMLSEINAVRNIDSSFVSPRSLNENDKLIAVKRSDWTSGFFPGVLWYLYAHTKDSTWEQAARKYTALIQDEQYNGKTHDMGFKIYCSVGNGYRLSSDTNYRKILIQAAKTLSTRFNPTVGCIRSWDHNSDKWDFPVIIDNMLNLELLFEATKLTGDSSFYKIAVSHANTTMKNHFRADYSTYHVIDYNPNTGAVRKRNTHQGYQDESTWSRGQAWALYGYTMCYRETGDLRYLNQADRVAKWLFNHPNMPADGVPYWDFNAPEIPNEPRDVSAATVIASALYELSTFSKEKELYLQRADKIINSLSQHYLARKGENKGFILLHSTGSKPSGTEVDKPLSYADYYFLEALQRRKKLNDGFVTSRYVKLSPAGELLYFADEKGNTIPDFSRVGYHQGRNEIPDVSVKITLYPSKEGKDPQQIQEAIDKVSAMRPDNKGFRGAILLKKGVYNIPGTIKINASGIVLKGEENGDRGTKLIASGKGKRSLIIASGKGVMQEELDSKQEITDDYVPVGAHSFSIASTKAFKEGDKIILLRPGTETWIRAIHMDKIVAREGTKQWKAAEYDLKFERTITKIEGNKVFLDNPILMAMDKRFGGGAIYHYSFDGRIKEVGIENILFESDYVGEEDEDHGWIAVSFDKIENAWIRNITAKYFGYAAVSLESGAKQISVLNSSCLDAKSIITGGRRYSFNNNGQLNLFMNLFATEGRHDYVTGARVLGPNVFYNCKAERTHADIGPHHRWAVGTLYDNITTDGEINVQDRGNWGSGHGWAGVTQIIWASTVKRAAVQNPWGAGKNYSIGLKGGKYEGRLSERPDGVWEGHNAEKLEIPSLYEAQVRSNK